MKIGYARSIPSHPDIASQLEALKQSGCQHIFVEPDEGAKPDFRMLETTLGYLRAGDVLVVCHFKCIARSLTHFLTMVNRLSGSQFEFQSLHEAIDTTGSEGQQIFDLFAALLEFDRSMRRERTAAGLAAAKARGSTGGRPKGLSEISLRKAALAEQLYLAGGMSIRQMCDEIQISRGTFYRYLKLRNVEIRPTHAAKNA